MAHFDSIALIRALNKIGQVKPIIRDGKLVHMTFVGSTPYIGLKGVLKTREIPVSTSGAGRILPASLRDISNLFNVQTKKGYFPYEFVKDDNLNYIGPLPPQYYFTGIPDPDYSKMVEEYKNAWSLKDATQQYLIRDVKALYEVFK